MWWREAEVPGQQMALEEGVADLEVRWVEQRPLSSAGRHLWHGGVSCQRLMAQLELVRQAEAAHSTEKQLLNDEVGWNRRLLC